MKLGVTFSGSGENAIFSHEFAEELRTHSIKIEMLSATSLAAVSALLWSRGMEPDEIRELMDLFWKAHSPSVGLWQLEKMGAFHAKKAFCNLAISSVDIATGITVVFCDILRSDAWNLKVYPLTGNEREALSAAICPFDGSDSQKWESMRLCDFAARYGCPFFPLKMAGMERLLAVSFAGGTTPAQIAEDSLSALTAKNADLHYLLGTGGKEEPRQAVRENLQALYETLLF